MMQSPLHPLLDKKLKSRYSHCCFTDATMETEFVALVTKLKAEEEALNSGFLNTDLAAFNPSYATSSHLAGIIH